MKVWAKVLRGDKILKDVIYEDDLAISRDNFQKLLQEVCYLLDLSVPVTLPTHFKHFERFNRIKFIARDFIEEVDFDSFIVERVVEDKKIKLMI